MLSQMPLSKIILQEEGAITPLYLAAHPEIYEEGIGGKYFTPYGALNNPGGVAGNAKLGDLLWAKSVSLCQDFDVPAEIL